ncbi:BUD13 homolog isoform X2 [Schistocerca gregaria]|nr:BUD13 homolog isoform X2 [Schistocerca gregaria]
MLGAFYLRLTGTSVEIYRCLERLYPDNRKFKLRHLDGSFSIEYIDNFIDQLLHEERVFDTTLPRLMLRHALVERNLLPKQRPSLLDAELQDYGQDDLEEKSFDKDASEDFGHFSPKKSLGRRKLDDQSPSSSPPRRRLGDRSPSSSPPRRRLGDRSPSFSPPRRRLGDRSPSSSPPRRRLGDRSPSSSPPRRRLDDRSPSSSPPRRRLGDRSPSSSPPRRRLGDRSPSSSPPRRRLDDRSPSSSPPRRRLGDRSPSSSPPRRRLDDRSPSSSPPRRRLGDRSVNPNFPHNKRAKASYSNSSSKAQQDHSFRSRHYLPPESIDNRHKRTKRQDHHDRFSYTSPDRSGSDEYKELKALRASGKLDIDSEEETNKNKSKNIKDEQSLEDQSTSESGGPRTLTLEETNELRTRIGLKPLEKL